MHSVHLVFLLKKGRLEGWPFRFDYAIPLITPDTQVIENRSQFCWNSEIQTSEPARGTDESGVAAVTKLLVEVMRW